MNRAPKIGLALAMAGAAFAAEAVAPKGTAHVYRTVQGRELKLYVQSPPSGAGPFAAMVFFHGGGWTGGRPTQFNEQGERLASLGMVTVQVEYRLLDRSGNEPPTVCIQDARSAMRWVRAHAAELKIDPKRIGAGGGSAGGHLAAFVGLMNGMDDPADDRSVSPAANALALFNPVFDNGPNGWGHKRVGDRYKEFSPFHNIKPGAPPAIVFVGSEDALLPAATVEAFCAAERAVKTRCEFRVYPGQKHGFFNYRAGGDNRYFAETLAETEKFLASLGWIRR
jgi:acetyl esterase/lipase